MKMKFFDMHCHLDEFEDAAIVVQNAQEAGIQYILTNGTNPRTNDQALALAEQFDIVHAALGLYPNDALELTDEQIQAELDRIASLNPVAIGEVGLDYHYDGTQQERMKEIFARVLVLAKKMDRPVIAHSRKAEADVIDMLIEYDVKACLHCFGGSLKLAKKAANAGIFFSIPATVVRATHFQRIVEEIPRELLLTETDAPYLSPDPETRNESMNVTRSVATIAPLLGLSVEETADLLWDNLQRFIA